MQELDKRRKPMKTIRIVGDVHGKIKQYQKVIEGCDESIQVGDMGAGFVTLADLNIGHKFIRGNHDNPAICKQSHNWIEDGVYKGSPYNMLFIGGAFSIDYLSRTIGRDWWEDEELSYQQFQSIIDAVKFFAPKIIISHDCPQSACQDMWPHILNSSRTTIALETIFNLHQPDLWIFGHHHESRTEYIRGTRFICLAELDYIDLYLEHDKKPKFTLPKMLDNG